MTGERQRIPALGQPRGAGLSLGAARGRSAGRGRPSSSSTSAARDDAAIRSTDNDAVGSRMAAIQHHYIKADPYTPLLYGAAASLSGPLLRPPIINIGTFLRCQAIDNLVDGFLEQGETSQKQIISLGAGSDSRYWRLHADPRKKAKLRHYIELDFKELTSTKVERMLRNKELLKEVASKEDDVRICECAAACTLQFHMV
jgi:[phosphatase 2A protein]-leucine-carboxy methyltransferase